MNMMHTITVAAVTAVTSLSASASERFWICGQGGTYQDALCWLDELEPTLGDTAVFDVGGVYHVGFQLPAFADRLVVRSGHISLGLQFTSYTLLNPQAPAPSIVVGDDTPTNTSLRVTAGTLAGNFVSLGRTPGALGALTLDPGQTELVAASQLHVGEGGFGMLDAGVDATVDTGSCAVALQAGSVGQVMLDTATLTCDIDLVIGYGGYGTLLADHDAFIDSPDGVIAQQLGSYGVATIRGPGTNWYVASGLDVGFGGQGFLTIEDGGRVEVGSFVAIGGLQFPGGQFGRGELRMDAGGSLDVDGDLIVGLFGQGTLVLANGGRATVGGALDAFQLVTPEIVFVLSDDGDYDTPAITASEFTGSIPTRVELDYEDDGAPSIGAEFLLASSPADLFTFNPIDLPELPAGRGWQLRFSETDELVLAVRKLPILGDTNGDGVVGVNDLTTVITSWGPCPAGPCPADVNPDGVVNVNDLFLVIENWM